MLQSQLFKSKFVKADMRGSAGGEGYVVRTSSFAGVAAIADVSLAAGAAFRPESAFPGGRCYILPVAGRIRCSFMARTMFLMPGSIYALPAAALPDTTFSNPFDEETVNVTIIATNEPVAGSPGLQASELPLQEKNRLVAPANAGLPVLVGVYDSRTKDTIGPDAAAGISLCYVINGSFEIEDRLAEYRDALLFWDHPVLEFEALSEAAILLHLRIATA